MVGTIPCPGGCGRGIQETEDLCSVCSQTVSSLTVKLETAQDQEVIGAITRALSGMRDGTVKAADAEKLLRNL